MRSKILTGFRAPLLYAVLRVCLKPPMPMDTNLHACGRGANQNSVTMHATSPTRVHGGSNYTAAHKDTRQ